MKQIIFSAITTLSVALFVATGCAKQNNDIKLPFCGGDACLKADQSGGMFSCEFFSFLESASRVLYYSAEDTEDRFIHPHVIIAEVLAETYLHGRKIRVIEDLAGNFPKDISTFMAWGSPGEGGRPIWGLDSNRIGFLSCSDCYKTGDRLVLILVRPYNRNNRTLSDYFPELEPDYEWILTSEHLVLLGCATSVLWLKGGFVMGNISEWKPQRMSWRNFQRELNNVLKK